MRGTNSVNGGERPLVDGGGWDILDVSTEAGPAVIDLTPQGPDTGSGAAAPATATMGAVVDSFTNIEGVWGTEGDDTLTWDGKAMVAPPGGGDLDNVFWFSGQGGTDLVDASTATRGVTLDPVLRRTRDLEPGRNTDRERDRWIGWRHHHRNVLRRTRCSVATGNDPNIFGAAGNDFIEGGLGNDGLDGWYRWRHAHVRARHRRDGHRRTARLHGRPRWTGLDLNFEIFKGSGFDDTIRGGQTDADANLRLLGRGGDDELVGTNSSNILKGGGGNDVLRAGGGDDDAFGGAGDDLVQGGSGDDRDEGRQGRRHRCRRQGLRHLSGLRDQARLRELIAR